MNSFFISLLSMFNVGRSMFDVHLASRSLFIVISGIWILGSASLPANTDTNNNGFSDHWEYKYNGYELLPTTFTQNADEDGDGVTNINEALADTDPFDGKPPTGFFAAEITHIPAVYITGTNGQPEIITPEAFVTSWEAIAGKHYTLQFSPNLTAGSWTPVVAILASNYDYLQVPVTPTQAGGGTPDKLFWRVAVNDFDSDGDGFNDWEEFQKGTDPLIPDRDDDGLPDAWEITHGFDPDDNGSINTDNGGSGDSDGDGLNNWSEYDFGSNPHVIDTDLDTLTDFEEAFFTGTSPTVPDSDNDGNSDPAEDYDNDGLTNIAELRTHLTHAHSSDTDYDTLLDGWELANGLDPLIYNSVDDPDADSLTNFQEQQIGTAPLIADTDSDGTPDGAEDPDNDGLTNLSEFNTHHTNPLNPDTDRDGLTDGAEINIHLTSPTNFDDDNDGLPDGWEVVFVLNPKVATVPFGTTHDPDEDGLSNFDEWLHGCHPNNPDTDGDGTNDGDEVAQGSNPTDASDGGDPPLADKIIEVPFTVSDPSASHSEKWKMTITGLGPDDTRTLSLASPGYGEQATKTYKLRKFNRYEISLSHLGTDPVHLVQYERADYDWEATVDGKPTSLAVEQIEEYAGLNNFFMVKDHWLVDNRKAVLTTEKHGDDDDIVSGKEAFLLPVEVAPEVLAVNSDFDEGRIDPATGYAIPDCDDIPGVDLKTGSGNTQIALNASRAHLDGLFANDEKVTDDMHKGWFGVNPNQLDDDFWDEANVTIRKIDKIDADTGYKESGQVRFYAKWSGGYFGISPYNFQTLQPVNLVSAGVNLRPGEGVYGTSSTIPDGAEFYMEGVRPGKITLEWRLQKGSIDVKHEQTFKVETRKTRDEWREEVVYQIRLQTKVKSGTEVDLRTYNPNLGFYGDLGDQTPKVRAIYYYYRQLFQQMPEKFMWAGMAKVAAAPIYAGMSDLTEWYHASELTPGSGFGTRDPGTRSFINNLLLSGQQRIFRDMAWTHRAYQASGIWAIKHVVENEDDVTDLAAWRQIDKGIQENLQSEINGGNKDLLNREQRDVVQRDYNAITTLRLRQPPWYLRGLFGAVGVPEDAAGLSNAGEWLSANSNKNPLHPAYPYTPKFRTTVPGGRLDTYLDRWAWTSNATSGMLEMWIGSSTAGPNFDAAKRMAHNNMTMYQAAFDYANDPPMLPND